MGSQPSNSISLRQLVTIKINSFAIDIRGIYYNNSVFSSCSSLSTETEFLQSDLLPFANQYEIYIPLKQLPFIWHNNPNSQSAKLM